MFSCAFVFLAVVTKGKTWTPGSTSKQTFIAICDSFSLNSASFNVAAKLITNTKTPLSLQTFMKMNMLDQLSWCASISRLNRASFLFCQIVAENNIMTRAIKVSIILFTFLQYGRFCVLFLSPIFSSSLLSSGGTRSGWSAWFERRNRSTWTKGESPISFSTAFTCREQSCSYDFTDEQIESSYHIIQRRCSYLKQLLRF